MQQMTFDLNALAKEEGLVTFDPALPQDWVNEVYAKTGYEPQFFGFVWCYDKAKVWGEPYPLTKAAEILLGWFKGERHERSR